MSKQDGYASRTPADLERKYKFGQTFAEVYGLVADARKIAEEAQSAYDGLNQEQIFNLLTNYGQSQGIYRGEDGNVYVNASYIQSGTLVDGLFPASITRKSELPGLFEQFGIDKGYLNETGVTSIVKGVVTTDYVNALGISVSAAQIKDVLVIGEQLPANLAVKSDIPTTTSQLTNNSGFMVNDVADAYDENGVYVEYSKMTGLTEIIGGVVTTDYIQTLGLTASTLVSTGDQGYPITIAYGVISLPTGAIKDGKNTGDGNILFVEADNVLQFRSAYNYIFAFAGGHYMELTRTGLVSYNADGTQVGKFKFEYS